jgi:ADP-dependent NAD(P)H-hydrate dehydratase / NAD(P)H-hydrate epimerase
MQKILTAEQFRNADKATIKNEPVKPFDLMERASEQCCKWIYSNIAADRIIHVVCGTGNNGGDGLAIARLLNSKGYEVKVWIAKLGNEPSDEFTSNYNKLLKIESKSASLSLKEDTVPVIEPGETVIDAIFGTGLSRNATGIALQFIQAVNNTDCTVISIDMPSGLYSDETNYTSDYKSIVANTTLTFQLLKKSQVLPDMGYYTGQVIVLDIGLDKETISHFDYKDALVEKSDVHSLIRSRHPFSHKGNYGHALIMAGSTGKTGACVLAVKACLRSGCGLTTAQIPGLAYPIIQSSAPEAMSVIDENPHYLATYPKHLDYEALGFGPGAGTNKETAQLLKRVIQDYKGKLVIDADGLNILAENPTWLAFVPPLTILTPHPGEFERLAGKWSDGFERNHKQRDFAIKHNVIVVLKGRYTAIADPGGFIYYNSTGNPGMAKGGSGDVLTGLITGLCARGLSKLEAAIAGVFIHGLAGDQVAEALTEEAMTAGDIVRFLHKAFKTVVKG